MRSAWRGAALGFALAGLAPCAAAAQQDAACAASPRCSAARQAAAALQPQLAVLAAGGTVDGGAAGAAGLRLGRLPGVSVALRAGAAELYSTGFGDGGPGEEWGIARALSGTAALRLWSGTSLTPAVTGVGAVELLATAGVLPTGETGSGPLAGGGVPFGGGGVRVGLLRESFVTPALSATVVYRRFGEAEFDLDGAGAASESRASFETASWSTRLVAGKRLGGVGALAGVGYEHASGEAEIAYVDPGPAPAPVLRREQSDGRGVLFAGLTGALPLLSWSAEAGWAGGGEAEAGFAVPGYEAGRGTWFGSLALRLAL